MIALRLAIGTVVLAALVASYYSLRSPRPPFQPVSISDASGDVQSNPRGVAAPAAVDLLDVTLTDVGPELQVDFRHAGEGPEPPPVVGLDRSLLGYTLALWDPQGRQRVVIAYVEVSPTSGWDAPSERTVYVCDRDGTMCPFGELEDAAGSIERGRETGQIRVPWEAVGGAPSEGFQWVLTSHWTIWGSEYWHWVDEVPNAGTLPKWHDSSDRFVTVETTVPPQPPAGAASIGP